MCIPTPGLCIETWLVSYHGKILRLEVNVFFRMLLQLLDHPLLQGEAIIFTVYFPNFNACMLLMLLSRKGLCLTSVDRKDSKNKCWKRMALLFAGKWTSSFLKNVLKLYFNITILTEIDILVNRIQFNLSYTIWTKETWYMVCFKKERKRICSLVYFLSIIRKMKSSIPFLSVLKHNFLFLWVTICKIPFRGWTKFQWWLRW